MFLNPDRQMIVIGETEIYLSRREFAFMERLMKVPGKLVSYDSLITAIWWNPDNEPDRARDCLSQLRFHINGKIRRAGLEPVIETVWGVGIRVRTENRK